MSRNARTVASVIVGALMVLLGVVAPGTAIASVAPAAHALASNDGSCTNFVRQSHPEYEKAEFDNHTNPPSWTVRYPEPNGPDLLVTWAPQGLPAGIGCGFRVAIASGAPAINTAYILVPSGWNLNRIPVGDDPPALTPPRNSPNGGWIAVPDAQDNISADGPR